MTSATQVYSFPAQLGRRGNTAVVVIGLHVIMALGLIAGTTLIHRPPKADPTITVVDIPKQHVPPPSRSFGEQPDTRMHLPPVPEQLIVPPDLTGPVEPSAPVGPTVQVAPDAGPVMLTPVRVIRSIDPVYTAIMIRANERGSVIMRVQVGVNGRPERIEVATSSGFPRLDEAAIAAVRHWMFAPAQTSAGAIESWVQFRVTFRLVE